MQRLMLGAVLLLGAIATGFVAGGTTEERVRAVTRTVTETRVQYRERPETTTRAEPVRDAGAASAEADPGDLPEAPGLVERMRHQFPDLGEWQADEIRNYHGDYKRKLHANAMNIASVLLADRESQRQAVEQMQALRRKRTEFMRNLLGRERWAQWKEIELNGGRNVDALLRELQRRKQGDQ